MNNLKIQVLGSGCPTCGTVYDMVSKIAKEIDETLEVEYITDISKIIELGLMTSPVVVIGDTVWAGSQIPSATQIREEITKRV